MAVTGELAVSAMTIPLWKPATGGTTQYADVNGASSVPLDSAGVAGALEKDRHILYRRFHPTLLRFLHVQDFAF